MLSRDTIINDFITRRGYKSYLEIGVDSGSNFAAIKIENKIGVDPSPTTPATYHLTSDAFFKQHPDKRFDIVFVDGLHHADQVRRDIENSLAVLNPGGVILCHDMLPSSHRMQVVPRRTNVWTGDCWKAFVRMRARADIWMCSLSDEPCGIGVIERGTQTPLVVAEMWLSYPHFRHNKAKWMNVMTVAQYWAMPQHQPVG